MPPAWEKVEAGTPVLMNGRTNRVIGYNPPKPGREPHKDRDNPFLHNADGWVKSMANHYNEVCPPNLWRIHGELYDLEKYLDVHPGGRVFLVQTRGSDCTESFECHHIRGVSKAIMDKYKVPTPTQYQKPCPDRFDYETHFRPIKQFVADYLDKKLKNPTGTTPAWAGVLYAAVVLQFVLTARFAAKKKSYLFAIIAGLLLTGCWGAGHNQVHRARKAVNKWAFLRFAMDLTGFSSYETTVTHAISHHQNANLQYDIEVFNFQAIGLYMLTNEPRESHWIYRYGIFFLSSALTSPFLYLTRMIQRIVLERDFLNPDIVIPSALMALMCKESGSVEKGIKMTFLMWAVFSATFVPGSLALHHSMDHETGIPLPYHEGEDDAQSDFAGHQILSTLDHSVEMNDYLALTLFAHLNVHTVHHLFPTIDRVYHLELLKALLEQNPGNFRELYNMRNKVNRNFWTELLPSVYHFIQERRFQVQKQAH